MMKKISRPFKFSIAIALAVLLFSSHYSYSQEDDVWVRPMGGEKFRSALSINWFAGYTLSVDFKTPRPPENENSIKAGKATYKEVCAECHGPKGDGKGERADELDTKPRDFTLGIYKFRSTPNAFPPTDDDIFTTISRGLHGTSMLPMLGLTTKEKWEVTYFIKTFSDVFEEEELVTAVMPQPVMSEYEYVVRGDELFKKTKCADCHGPEGYGDGEKADKLKDDWGKPIRPANFQKHYLKRGLEIEDIYLTIATGLDGTPMDSFSEKLDEDEIVALSYYVRWLAKKPSLDGMTNPSDRERNRTPDENIGMRILFHDLWGHEK